MRKPLAALAALTLAAGLAVTSPAAASRPVVPVIGARAAGPSLADFTAAQAAIGPLHTTRLFYPRALPPSQAGTVAARLPRGVIPVVSYKTPGTNVVAYARSVRRKTWLVFHHEPEGPRDFTSGAAFVRAFIAQAKLIRSAHNPLVRVTMVAGGFAYRDGGPGTDGSYLPPARWVDRWGLDVYQDGARPSAWPARGLADYPRFTNWRRLLPRGVLWGLTEYGITGVSDTARDNRIITDCRTLRGIGGGWVMWQYWWHDNPPQADRFTDPATEATWSRIASRGRCR